MQDEGIFFLLYLLYLLCSSICNSIRMGFFAVLWLNEIKPILSLHLFTESFAMPHLNRPIYIPRRASQCRAFAPRRAFTLIEIMIVTLIIGILLSIALPNFTHARETARQKSCIGNLKEIRMAKELWAMDNQKPNGTPVQLSELVGVYITPNRPGNAAPTDPINLLCPSSGLPYSTDIGVVGEAPQCPTVSARTGPSPHILP